MIVQLTDDLRVSVDRYNHTLEERVVAGEKAKNPGAVSWVSVAHCDSMQSAVAKAAHMATLASGVDRMSLADWVLSMRENTERLTAKVSR